MRRGWKTLITAGLTLALAGFLTIGCGSEDPQPEGATGSLSINLALRGQKTIWPEGWVASIGTFEVSLYVGEELVGGPVAISDTAVPTEFTDLPYGTYKVTVTGVCRDASAYCAPDAQIAFGEDDDVEINSEDALVVVVVQPFVDPTIDGAMEIILEWPDTQGVTKVETFIKSISDVEWPVTPEQTDLTPFDNSEDHDYIFIDTTVPAGSNMILFKLYDVEENPLATVIEVVNIYSNYTTDAFIILTADDFTQPTPPVGYDLTLQFDNWLDWANDKTFHFPHTDNFDLTGDIPSYTFPDPREGVDSLTIPFASDEAGVVEFQVLSTLNYGDCWDFSAPNHEEVYWTLANIELDGDNPCQLIVDCSVEHVADGLSGIAVTLDDAARTATAVCVVPEDPKGTLNVDIVVQDYAPESPLFEITCSTIGEDLKCQPSPAAVGASYKWYLNGVLEAGGALLPDEDEVVPALTLAKEGGVKAGDRIILVVSDPPMAHSAQLTITQAMLDEEDEVIVWDFIQTFTDMAQIPTSGSYDEEKTYNDNTTGVTWTLSNVREGHAVTTNDYTLEPGLGILMRKMSDNPSIKGTDISGGISRFAIDVRKAYTGNSERHIEILINGNSHQFGPLAFSDGADHETIHKIMVSDLEIEGQFSIEVKLPVNSTNRHITVNSIRWVGYTP